MLVTLLLGAALAATPPEATVATAGHHGTFTGEAMAWESTFVLSQTAFDGARIPLAAPLPAGAQVTGARPARVAPVYDEAGSIVALELDGAASRVVVTLTQPAAEGPIVLGAPLAAGDGVQRVTFDGVVFEPDPGLGVERRLADARQAGVSRQEKRRADRALGRAKPADQPLYLVADARLEDAGGLSGTIVAAGRREAAAAVAIGLAFAGTILALLVGRKVLARAAAAEAVDAYIRDEFVRFEKKEAGGPPTGPR